VASWVGAVEYKHNSDSDEEPLTSIRLLRLSESLGQQLVLPSYCTGGAASLILVVADLCWMTSASSVKS
jgi:hypothetical protein